MPDNNLQKEALEEARKLNQSITNLSKDTKELTAYGHRNRDLIKLLAVSYLLSFVLSIVLGFAVIRANSAANKANKTAEKVEDTRGTQYDNCVNSNKTRLTQIALWNNVFDTIGENRLPEIPELRRQVETAFAQRECILP